MRTRQREHEHVRDDDDGAGRRGGRVGVDDAGARRARHGAVLTGRAAAFALFALVACGAPIEEEVAKGDAAPATERPNVLFICVDDLRPELLAHGGRLAVSPRMDEFAASAAVFTNHFVQAPSCGPSRAALLTGLSPARTGRLRNDCLYAGPNPLPDSKARTLPGAFNDAGYRTICIGKVSHTPDGRVFAYNGSGDGRAELPGAWDELDTPTGVWERGWGAFFAYTDGVHREDGSGRRQRREFIAERDTDLPDGLIAERAIARLHELGASDDPFFLAVGFYKPHLPWVAPKSDLDQTLSRGGLPAHPDPPDTAHGTKSGEFSTYSPALEPGRPLDEQQARFFRRAYFACVRYVDRQVGRVLDALAEAGLEDDTVVVLWSDHGWHLGDSSYWGKHTLFDRSLHAPLVVRAPGVTRPGSKVDTIVEAIDVAPTLFELCALDDAAAWTPMDGTSRVDVLKSPDTAPPDDAAAFSYWGRGATIRTSTHRLVARRSKQGKWRDVELYRVADGPDPIEDVAGSEPEIAAKLLERLERRAPGTH